MHRRLSLRMVFVNVDVEFEEVLSKELFDHVFLVQE